MILAEDNRHDPTGVILVTVVTEKMLKAMQKTGKEERIVNLVDNLTTFITQIIKD